jgi:hypothetical protein
MERSGRSDMFYFDSDAVERFLDGAAELRAEA